MDFLNRDEYPYVTKLGGENDQLSWDLAQTCPLLTPFYTSDVTIPQQEDSGLLFNDTENLDTEKENSNTPGFENSFSDENIQFAQHGFYDEVERLDGEFFKLVETDSNLKSLFKSRIDFIDSPLSIENEKMLFEPQAKEYIRDEVQLVSHEKFSKQIKSEPEVGKYLRDQVQIASDERAPRQVKSKPSIPFSCKICHKSYKTADSLRKHKHTHRSTFLCTFCVTEKVQQRHSCPSRLIEHFWKCEAARKELYAMWGGVALAANAAAISVQLFGKPDQTRLRKLLLKLNEENKKNLAVEWLADDRPIQREVEC
ncbi:hypothetical protein CANARDRAFT_9135 [[Candida] arabinofermentans NRRL YB-2248]|uniref:C2H2-type domain-containing protein n=1 Tax=[Candida] arabinofermentans NRRL YB-2248 TaxID=983967 RepID=A0A1E4SWG9_9ASCO|nr:hypothetical protein CANARDRAFT_9135 [[Candida] arabinofermentans NRRL YB-2248]